MNARFLACATALPVLLALHTPAHAVATIETVVSAASLAAGEATVVGTGAVVAGGGAVVKVASTSWWGNLAGDLLVVGGIAIAVLDPPAGTFYSGAYTIHYPSALFAPYQAGWLGDWSETPSDAAPPADPLGFPNGAQFTIHVANPAMQTSTTDPGGLQTTTFDWGPQGHAASGSDPFNMYAAMFTAKETVNIGYLGTFDAGAPPPAGANYYVTSTGMQCSTAGSTTIRTCGDAQTQYFEVSSVPEPSDLLLMFGGLGLVASAAGRRRRC